MAYKSEFRYHDVIVRDKNGKNKNIPHPAYIWQKRNNLYDYHSITHSKKVKGIKLRKFKVNPNPKDKRKSYYEVKSRSDFVFNFGKRKKEWKIHPLDKRKIHKNKKVDSA